MAFTIKIFERDFHIYSLLKSRLGFLYTDAYITNPWIEPHNTDQEKLSEYTRILYNPVYFKDGFDPAKTNTHTLLKFPDDVPPIPIKNSEGLISISSICEQMKIKPRVSGFISGISKPAVRGVVEVLLPFVYIGDREQYIHSNYSRLIDSDLAIRLDFTSRFRSPDDKGAGILSGNMTGLLEACSSRKFMPDDILKYCCRDRLGFMTPGASKGDDDVYDYGSTKCRILLDKCRQLADCPTRTVNTLAVIEGFRTADIPAMVSDCDKVTLLFPDHGRNGDYGAASLITAVKKSLTRGTLVTDCLEDINSNAATLNNETGYNSDITGNNNANILKGAFA